MQPGQASDIDHPPLRLRERLSYGVGQYAEGLLSGSLGIFLLFYYNQVLGLAGGLAGAAIFLGTACDAVADPWIGAISDRTRSRLGRRHPLMFAATLPLSASILLLFAPPGDMAPWGLFVWLAFFNIAARISLSLFYVPHLALGAELSSDYHDRNRIVAIRQFFSLLGYASAMVIGLGIFFADSPTYLNGQLNARAYPPFALVVVSLMCGAMLVSAIGTTTRIRFLKRPDRVPILSVRQFFTENIGILRQSHFRGLFLGILSFYAVVGVQFTLMLYMNIHFWRLSSHENSIFATSGLAATAAAIPLWSYISKFFEKKTVLIFGLACWLAFIVLPPTLALIDLFPLRESAIFFPALVATALASGFGGAATTVVGGSMVADCVDYHELTTGQRQEGNFFGAYAFAGKALTGIGTWLGGLVLDIIKFPINATTGNVPRQTLTELALYYGPGLAIGGSISFALISGYRLSRAQYADTLLKLAEKRRTRSGTAAEREGHE